MRRFAFFSAIAALALASAAGVADSSDIPVPTEHTQISSAVNDASNGDTISIVAGDSYDPFTVNKDLLIRNLNDSTITITASAGNPAISFTSSNVSTVDGGVHGFQFVGSSGATSVVKLGKGIMTNCTVDDNGNAYATDAAVRINIGGTLQNCHINLSSTSSAYAIEIETTSGAEVSIFDISGRLVRSIDEHRYPPGDHRVVWDGTSDAGRTVSSGLYFVRVSVNDISREATKILVAR